ncbi:MAG: sugar ABC transporter ATP-binding protein [Thermoleophilaceae bacterium]|nr:sugar ABC transporter ATP-binding protein [Thermoleophilaceae bacterium]
MKAPPPQPILEARDVVKTFGHVEALRGVDLVIGPAEIVALVGDNGAGKSTLVKVLSGVLSPDRGEIWFSGQRLGHQSPLAARGLGIETVYQDLALAEDLSPHANLFLGREMLRPGVLGRLGFLDNTEMRKRAKDTFETLGVDMPTINAAVANLSGGQRQAVAVSRAMTWASKVVFMDEPTAALGVIQTRTVLDLIRRVRDAGISVVLISHNLPEVLQTADRIEVLRLGRRVASFAAADVGIDELTRAMTGALTEAHA